jgi:hypothetical protein
MAFNTAFGSTLAISTTTTTSATDTQAEFEALAYTAIGEIESVGDLGDTFQAVTFTALGDGRVRKLKGTADAGDLTVTVAFDSTDTGQDAMRTALASQSNQYAFRLQVADGSSGSPSAPSTQFFLGRVMSGSINVGDANNVVRQTFTIGIDSPIILVDAV